MIMSIRNPSQRSQAMNAKNDFEWASCSFANFFWRYAMASFVRIVAMPLKDSERQLKMGDRAIPSIRFNSRDVLRKIPRTRRKYHTNGGRKIAVSGRMVKVLINAPIVMKRITEKSNSATGN
mmetsp:Transcript_4820/g.8206  ORF Transcript_4820/g.8206 Transcript_4820/m.8206 type:complete len:122 (-) Transcript_4820:1335-1700(-)